MPPELIAAGASAVGGLLGANQTRGAQANAENSASDEQRYALQQAQAARQKAYQQALQGLMSFTQQNPNPVNSWAPIQAPGQFGGTVGGGMIGSNSMPQGGQSQPNLKALAQFLQARGMGGGMQPPQQGMMPPPNQLRRAL